MPYRIVAALENQSLIASLGNLPQILAGVAAGADHLETAREVANTLFEEMPCSLVEVLRVQQGETIVLHSAGERSATGNGALTVPTAAPDIRLRIVFRREEDQLAWDQLVRATALLIGLGADSRALAGRSDENAAKTLDAIVRDVEAREIRGAIESCAGDVVAAANRLGVPRSTFYRKMKALGITTGNGAGTPPPADERS